MNFKGDNLMRVTTKSNLKKYLLEFTFLNRPKEKVTIKASDNLEAIPLGLNKLKCTKEDKVVNVNITYL